LSSSPTYNGLTGSYSLHETSSNWGTDYASDTDAASDYLSDGATNYEGGTDASTDYEYAGSTADESGDEGLR
jgi:hypothetical protein